MNNPPRDQTSATSKKIAALVEQLRQTERELQELTGGQLDAVTAYEGSPILLREAQEKLRQQEAAQRQAAEIQMAILNALPAHIALLDHQGVILAVNEAWRRFASANILQSTDFFVGQNYLGVCENAHGDCAEEAHAVANGIRRVLRGELPEFSMEYPCHSHTEQRWFRLMVTPLREVPGQGAVVMHVDVSERRLAEETLRENRASLEGEARRLHESQAVANVGSWETDLGTLKVTWTAETYRIFGTEPALFAPTHASFLERVHPADREAVNTAFLDSLGKAGPFAIEHRVVMLDGSVKFLEERWQTFTDDAGKPARAVGTCQDITKRKLAEEVIQARARQQETIARLGFEATRAISLESIFEISVRMVAAALEVELCKVLQLSPDGTELRLVSGIGWNPGLVGTVAVAVDFDTQAGFTLQTGGPVYVSDFSLESRFKATPMMRTHDVVSGLSVTIMLRDKPWGVLGAHSRTIRRFNEEDAHFMQSVATLLSVVVERLAVQRSLSESDRRMRDAQRIAHLGNWEIDLMNSRLTWSDEVFQIFGTKPEHFPDSYEAFMSFVHPEDRRKVEAAQEVALSGIGPLEVEHRILRPDGTVRYVRERGEVIQDETGNAVALSGTVLDITDLRLAQGRAEKMTTLLTEAQRVAGMGSWEIDMASGTLIWAEETCRMFGIDPGDFGGTYESFVQFLLPEDRAAFDGSHQQAVENGGLLEAEYRIRRADGEVRWMFERGRLIFDPDGVLTRRMGVVMDITERKRSESVQVWETQVLEAVTSGQPLSMILNRIADGVENAIPGAMASILLLDESGEHLRHGAAPHLPEAYNEAIDGVKVGPTVGSCGTAVHRREPVFVTDIQSDPLWQDFRELAEQHGLRACWSMPVINAAGRVLASLAVYYNQPRDPQPRDIALIKRTAHITGIAVERVRKEKELRLLETCVSRLNDIVLITDAEPIDAPGPRILFVNDAFVRRTGYTREEVIGKSPRLLQGPKTQRDALDRIRASLKAWKPVREQLINYTKSGEEFWLELDIVPVADATGWFTHWVSIERDITERKLAEMTLAESQRQYRDLVETSHNVIWAVDMEGRFTFLNQAARAIYGREPEEMIGRRFHEFVPEEQHQANDEIMASMLRDGRDTLDYSNRIRRKDGSIAILNSNARVVRDIEGQMIGISGMSQDITESLKAQEALASSEQRLRMALNAAHMGTYEWNIPDERIVWSREHEELWGYAAGEFDGTYEAFAKRMHRDDVAAINAEIARCMSAQEQFNWEFRVIWPDGTLHWMAGIGEFSYDKAGQPVRMHGAVMEITERRIAIEQLRQREELLEMAGTIARMGGWSVEYPEVRITWSDEVCALHDLPAGTVPTLDQALEFYAPSSREIIAEAVSTCVRDGTPFDLELELITASGRKIWTRSIGQAEHDSAGVIKRVQGAFQDITDRKEAERELARINRALKLLSGCNEALIHAEDEITLLRDVCQLAVESGGYRMAWVGYAQDDEKRSIKTMAHAGVEDGYLSDAKINWDEDNEFGQGPAGRVIRGGKPIVCEDMESDASFHWLEPARRRGYRAVTCLPLRDKKRTFGLLGLYSSEVNVTNAEEMKLLQEMADDLAFGILNLRAKIDQRRTHEAVITMARGISASTGNEFFENLTLSMVEALGAHAGFIARLSDDKSMAATLCAVVEGRLAPNFEYALSGNPCEHLRRNDVLVVPQDLQQLYPQARTLQDLGVNAYVGTELYGGDGKPCGQMSVLFRQPLEKHDFISSTLKIFASRAAGELERQKTDAKLREQATLLDKAQDAILVRDLNHKILYWNRSAERLYGWTAEEAVGCSAHDLIYHEAALLDATLKVLMAEGEWIGEVQQFNKGGKSLTVEARLSLVRDEQGNPKAVLAINTDVTERKKIEAQYLRAQRMESIGTLAGGIAHDLNNVLAPIMMSIELLKMQEQNPMRLNVLTTIEGSAKRGADMVKQVLSFARGVEGQQLQLQVGHLLHEIKKIANETFLKNIQVSCDVPAELWVVKGDPTQLHQVLLNLCVNARDAMPDGGRITLTAKNLMIDEQYAGMNIEAKPGPHVCIQVEDNGTGMPPEVTERIFEPFFTTKELGKGTGLGLSTTIAIIKSHGGFVRVYSEVGMGTRFHIYLPAQTEPGVVGPEAAEPDLPRGNGELVLVIDDEAAVRQITRQTLEAFGYRVLLASDGVEATTIYATRQQEIDVVLTDMMMPLMDGPTTIMVLLRMKPELRIIAASGLNANGMVAKATSAGVKHFIPKPYTAETLLKTIREVLTENPIS
jgi:PAS domain S-box-containing protein